MWDIVFELLVAFGNSESNGWERDDDKMTHHRIDPGAFGNEVLTPLFARDFLLPSINNYKLNVEYEIKKTVSSWGGNDFLANLTYLN